jgi:hypothetical protein
MYIFRFKYEKEIATAVDMVNNILYPAVEFSIRPRSTHFHAILSYLIKLSTTKFAVISPTFSRSGGKLWGKSFLFFYLIRVDTDLITDS